MNEYKQQYDRVKRFFSRLTNQNHSQIDYEDDLWAFFQNCWHLKDWIKNDLTIPQNIRGIIEKEARKYKSLRIAADLANRSKHSKLTPEHLKDPKCLDAKNTKKSVTVHVPCLHLHLNSKTGESHTVGECRSEYFYTIATKDGSEYDALQIAKKAITDWDTIIKKMNI
jgi:hypothetical protein